MVRTPFLTLRIAVVVSVMFLGACAGSPQADMPEFDGDAAFAHLEHQVAFGPRVPGTDAHTAARDWLIGALRSHTSHAALQPFSGIFGGTNADMSNIMASFYPEKQERILLCAHWDSRHHADKDPDPARHTDPVPGANDGASGVAVLLEVARLLEIHEPPYGVDIVLFDGEDGGTYGDDSTWILGSRHFAKVMPMTYMPKFAVLLDMIGDADLGLTRDYSSMQAAPGLWKRIEGYCDEIGIPFLPGTVSILDDHIPLISRGIQAVDLIDFDYPPWHTVADTPDKCSPESLQKIGDLVLKIVYTEI